MNTTLRTERGVHCPAGEGRSKYGISGQDKRLLLTGSCSYELTGLFHLLSAQGYEICCLPMGDTGEAEAWDLIVVALSAEQLGGWGRHLSQIREMRTRLSGEMIVLVPEMLKRLRMLRGLCHVYSGRERLQRLRRYVLNCGKHIQRKSSGEFKLTAGQRFVLRCFHGRMFFSLNPHERWLYYHCHKLAENVGVRDFKMVLITGLDNSLIKSY